MPVKSRHMPVNQLTSPPGHHFFGYYDKFPWDETGRYVLSLKTEFIDRPPSAEDRAIIGLIDTERDNEWIPVTHTHAWNWQQGAMLQWLPGGNGREVVYNARRDDEFVGVIHDTASGERKILPRPIYALSRDGKWAVSVNFSRIHVCRPGYGYAGVPDPWAEEAAPAEDGIYLMNMETGEHRFVISIEQMASRDPRPGMDNAKHYFNHLQFNSDGSRFLFLHRWRKEEGRETRLYTASPGGSDIYCVADEGMVSHFDWRDDKHILAWARQKEHGDAFYLFHDQTTEKEVIGRETLTCDGHCSYSPDRAWILTDSYPDKERMRALMLYDPDRDLRVDIGRFYAPPELDGEIRCDLHPRWNRDGTKICFDSVHEDHRQLYVTDVSQVIRE
ncbi:MAG: hypothetical protein ACLFWL_01740 [Candidatus Brocadiia bacterium]